MLKGESHNHISERQTRLESTCCVCDLFAKAEVSLVKKMSLLLDCLVCVSDQAVCACACSSK